MVGSRKIEILIARTSHFEKASKQAQILLTKRMLTYILMERDNVCTGLNKERAKNK